MSQYCSWVLQSIVMLYQYRGNVATLLLFFASVCNVVVMSRHCSNVVDVEYRCRDIGILF